MSIEGGRRMLRTVFVDCVKECLHIFRIQRAFLRVIIACHGQNLPQLLHFDRTTAIGVEDVEQVVHKPLLTELHGVWLNFLYAAHECILEVLRLQERTCFAARRRGDAVLVLIPVHASNPTPVDQKLVDIHVE